jgi:hypothetical protein
MKSRQQELSQKAHEEQRRCRDWLLRFMKNKHPKFLTKSELRAAAIRKFNVSKNSFDFAWIDPAELIGCGMLTRTVTFRGLDLTIFTNFVEDRPRKGERKQQNTKGRKKCSHPALCMVSTTPTP